MPVPRYGSHTRVGRSVQYQGGGGFMAGIIKDLAGAGLHSAVDRNMPYLGTGRKMSKSVHIAGRVLGYGWERRSRSKKRTKVPWYISTYDVGGPVTADSWKISSVHRRLCAEVECLSVDASQIFVCPSTVKPVHLEAVCPSIVNQWQWHVWRYVACRIGESAAAAAAASGSSSR